MPVPLFMDVHVPQAITDQLRRHGVDVLTAIEDRSDEISDGELLERARLMGRLTFTHDIRFKALAEDWQRTHRPFAGLVFGHPMAGTIGDFVRDLLLIAEASEPDEWLNVVERIPW